jgi:hypothetical protein
VSITRQVSAARLPYRSGNRQDTRRQATWRHDHTTEHIHAPGASFPASRTSVIFFGALHGGYAHALELSLAQLGVLLLAVAGLTRLLPAPAPR